MTNAARRAKYAESESYRTLAKSRANAWYEKNAEKRSEDNRSFKRRSSLLWTYAKQRAKRAELDFTITLDDVRRLILNSGSCPYTGVVFSYEVPEDGVMRNPWAPSLDRVEGSKGYVLGNVEVVSTWYNLAKNEWSAAVIERAISGLMQVRSLSK